MATLSIRVSEKDNDLFRKYAEFHNIDLSTLIREAVIAKIEEEYDLTLFDKIWAEDKTRHSHKNVRKELGL